MKEKIKICEICKQNISNNQEYYKITKNIIYPDYDGIWHNFGKVIICGDCLKKISAYIIHN